MATCSSKSDWTVLLKQALPNYEQRPQQMDMMDAVSHSLQASEPLLIEAGTGVGKTFAYLLPLIEHIENLPKPVLIATATRHLQDQLINKDIPFVQHIMGQHDLQVVVAKGKNNYICYQKLMHQQFAQREFFEENAHEDIERLLRWAQNHDTTGDIASAPFEPSAQLKQQITCHQDTCFSQQCSYPQQCFFRKSREQLEYADIIVANHHLMLSDLLLKSDQRQLLPDYQTIIIDEAHQLASAAQDCFAYTLSDGDFDFLLKYVQEQSAFVSAGLTYDIQRASDHLYSAKTEVYETIFKDHTQTYGSFLLKNTLKEPFWMIQDQLHHLERSFTTHKDLLKEQKKYVPPTLDRIIQMCESFSMRAELFAECDLDHYTYWGEKRGHRKVLHATPLTVDNLLKQHLFAQTSNSILTSATMSIGESLDYSAQKLGLHGAKQLKIDSPFNLSKQMKLIVTKDPELNPQHDNYEMVLASYCLELCEQTKGGIFLLFTNDKMMQRVFETISTHLIELGLIPLCQNKDSKNDIMDQFQNKANCVLFGLDSFWTGVDIQGHHLRHVVITKLPFPVPYTPLNQSLSAHLEEKGKNGFAHFMLPEALLKFKQGVGRLIRSHNDQGYVTILDPRITQKNYGRRFLNLLKGAPVVTLKSVDEVKKAFL